MDKGLIPRRYAKALYEVALQRKDDANIYALMQTLAASFADQDKLASTLANPFISGADKKALLTAAAGGKDAAADPTFADFLKLLEQNGRLDMAREIALAYIDIYRAENHIFKVTVTSAAPLSDAEKQRLQTIIRKHIGTGTLECDYRIDPSLIGGFAVTLGSERLDASVANQLKQMRLQLL